MDWENFNLTVRERRGGGEHLFYEEKTPWGKSAARFGILGEKRERGRERIELLPFSYLQ